MAQVKSGLSPEAVAARKIELAEVLKRMQDNPRVSQVTLVVPADACQSCRELAGTYPKDAVPEIPVDACSHPLGCRSRYQPFLNDVYP